MPAVVRSWEDGWQPWPTVPDEIAAWSPRVHALTSQALHGRGSLNALPHDDPTSRRDRDELRSAFAQATDRLRVDERDSTLHSPGSTNLVESARAALLAEDLDATLRHLVAADARRRPVDAGRRETAVTNAWRSDLTAAAEVRAQVRASGTVAPDGPAAMPVREDELALLERVDPTAADAGDRGNWSHRRPERVVDQPPPQWERGRRFDGSD